MALFPLGVVGLFGYKTTASDWISAITSEAGIYFMLGQTVLFLSTWFMLRLYVQKHGPLEWAGKLQKRYCLFWSAISVLLLLLTLFGEDESARVIYHSSKFIEYIDIFFTLLQGRPIDLWFGVHHTTMPWITFVRVVSHSHGWWVISAMNAAHHVFAYAFFGGVRWLRPVVNFFGPAHMIFYMVAEWCVFGIRMWNIWAGMPNRQWWPLWTGNPSEPPWINVFGGVILTSYVFLRQYKDTRCKAPQPATSTLVKKAPLVKLSVKREVEEPVLLTSTFRAGVVKEQRRDTRVHISRALGAWRRRFAASAA